MVDGGNETWFHRIALLQLRYPHETTDKSGRDGPVVSRHVHHTSLRSQKFSLEKKKKERRKEKKQKKEINIAVADRLAAIHNS